MPAPSPESHPAGDVKPPRPIDLARARLEAGGLRITRPRLAILAALIRMSEPADVARIHGELGTVRCDIVTVYRCLAAFEEIGLVRRAFSIDGAGRYAIDLGEPAVHHVLCRKTGRRDKIGPEAEAELDQALRTIEEKLRARGYTDLGHLVEFYGNAPGPENSREI